MMTSSIANHNLIDIVTKKVPLAEDGTLSVCVDINDVLRVNRQIEGMNQKSVSLRGFLLGCIKEQTEEICLEAIRNDVDSLPFVNDQTDQICFEAVKKDPEAMKHIRSEETKQLENRCID